MDNYRCTVCGYVYDPQAGDPDHGIDPGTVFDDLPADWVCPLCGAGKDAFEREGVDRLLEASELEKALDSQLF